MEYSYSKLTPYSLHCQTLPSAVHTPHSTLCILTPPRRAGASLRDFETAFTIFTKILEAVQP